MSTYAIGDLQGCLDPLLQLLDKVHFDPAADTLWFVGDLVNRGPQSLEALRFVRGLGDSAVTVLGNHDLHLLAVSTGQHKRSSRDTLDPILNAPDRQELCDWIRHLPLLHHDTELGFTMVHAGLYPAWTLALATELAREVEKQLSADDYKSFLLHMYGNKPSGWKKKLSGMDRSRFAINCFTRLRYIDESGKLDFDCKGPPSNAPTSVTPWFKVAGRKNRDLKIVFGHWSSLGKVDVPGIYATDRGCVWGGCLSAINLETETITEVLC